MIPRLAREERHNKVLAGWAGSEGGGGEHRQLSSWPSHLQDKGAQAPEGSTGVPVYMCEVCARARQEAVLSFKRPPLDLVDDGVVTSEPQHTHNLPSITGKK